MLDQQTFESAAYYMWLQPDGTAIGEFSSIAEADSYPLVDEYWVLLGFDEDGNEL